MKPVTTTAARIDTNTPATPTAKANGIGGAEKANIDRMVREIVSAFGLKQSPNPDLMFNAGFMPPKPERMIFTK